MKRVPHQYTGAQSATIYSVRRHDIKSAEKLFEKVKTDLLNINQWHTIAGTGTVFRLIHASGTEINWPVEKDTYIRIEIPAVPGSAAGSGYEWVKIEKIDEKRKGELEYLIIRVRPSSPPFAHKNDVAHFFTADATSSFCVERQGRKVTAAIYGRNERPNMAVSGITDKIRNFFVGLGAMIGFNKPLWKKLVKGLLKKNIK